MVDKNSMIQLKLFEMIGGLFVLAGIVIGANYVVITDKASDISNDVNALRTEVNEINRTREQNDREALLADNALTSQITKLNASLETTNNRLLDLVTAMSDLEKRVDSLDRRMVEANFRQEEFEKLVLRRLASDPTVSPAFYGLPADDWKSAFAIIAPGDEASNLISWTKYVNPDAFAVLLEQREKLQDDRQQ